MGKNGNVILKKKGIKKKESKKQNRMRRERRRVFLKISQQHKFAP